MKTVVTPGKDELCGRELNNLITIIGHQYSHICLNYLDITDLLRIPSVKRGFYEIFSRKERGIGKRGWFNNGKTTCWINYWIPSGHLKIAAETDPTNTETGWFSEMSFQEEGSPEKISKTLKLKAFW